MKMMYALKFIVFAVFCLTTTTRPTLANVDQLNRLLLKPYWAHLVWSYPNAQIYDTQEQTVSVSELFARLPDGTIVNENNFNTKVRQFFHLLTILCSDAVAWNLRYMNHLVSIYNANRFRWNIHKHINSLICDSHHFYTAMREVLWSVTRMCRAGIHGDDYVPAGWDHTFGSEINILVSTNRQRFIDTLADMKDIYMRLKIFLKCNSDIVNWINRDTPFRYTHIYGMATNDCTRRRGTPYVESYLKISNDWYIESFMELGFEYNENTREIRFV